MSDIRPRTDFTAGIFRDGVGVSAISPLTNRRVLFNDQATEFLIRRNADMPAISIAIDATLTSWQDIADLRDRVRVGFLEEVEALGQTTDPEHFARDLTDLLAKLGTDDWRAKRPRVADMLFALWASGQFSFPEEFPYRRLPEPPIRFAIWNAMQPQMEALYAFLNVKQHSLWQITLFMLTRVAGVIEIGDIPPALLRRQMSCTPEALATKRRTAALRIRAMLAQLHGAAGERLSAVDYAVLRNKPFKLDKTFQWAVSSDDSLHAWQQEALTYIEGEIRGHAGKTTGINAFFDFLLAHPGEARDPISLVRGGELPSDYRAWLREHRKLSTKSENFSRYINVASDLMASVIQRHWVDDGIVASGVRNPISRESRAKTTRSRTNRRALPSYIIRRMIEIVIEDDFAWPRSMDADYFHRIDPVTMAPVRIWSPVRAIAILLKTHLPLRTFQVRVLNSGEADPIVYRPEEGGWITNTHVLARPNASPAGAIRRFRDDFSDTDFNGFYINTNKTQDTNLKSGPRGYEIPWNYSEVIDWLCMLRDFQEIYNPVWTTTIWADLHERYVQVTFSQPQLKDRGSETFLFRDPCGPHPREPISSGRVDMFWDALCVETERQLAVDGVTLPDGTPIKLVEWKPAYNNRGKVAPFPLYDLHSLRVGLLTSLATEGKVPIPVLARCVAGHSNILMTLYYQDLGVNYINETLSDAQNTIRQQEQQRFLTWMRDQESIDAFAERSVAVSPDGWNTLLKGEPGSWIVMDHGICPTGCTRCNDGGPPATTKGEYRRHHPVPVDHNGAARNCARCRFFITGPCFLVGLQALFNATGLALQSQAALYRERQAQVAKFDRLLHEAQSGGAPFDRHREHQAASDAMDAAELTLDEIAHTWHAQYALTEQCASLLSTSAGDQDRFALMTVGERHDITVALEHTTDFDLVDSICQSAAWFKSVVPEIANLKRSRMLDAMLSRNGRSPVFSFLDERDCLQIGNELSKFLRARIGRADTARLIDGRLLLSELGIGNDIDAALKHATPKPYEAPSAIPQVEASAHG